MDGNRESSIRLPDLHFLLPAPLLPWFTVRRSGFVVNNGVQNPFGINVYPLGVIDVPILKRMVFFASRMGRRNPVSVCAVPICLHVRDWPMGGIGIVCGDSTGVSDNF